MKAIIFSIALALCGSVADAQILNPNAPGQLEARLRNVEQKSLQLEQQNQTLRQRYMQLDSRVRQLEEYLNGNPIPSPLPPIVEPGGAQVCVMVNSYYNKAHVSKSTSRIEAEALVRNACSAGGMPSYCQKATCDTEDYREHICRMTNTYYNKDAIGRSNSVLEARARARNACVAFGMPSYCAENTVVCD